MQKFGLLATLQRELEAFRRQTGDRFSLMPIKVNGDSVLLQQVSIDHLVCVLVRDRSKTRLIDRSAIQTVEYAN